MRIRISILVCVLFVQATDLFAQTGKTYAVVIGISQYQNSQVPKLNFADKDATLFADWLKTKAGGSVPGYQVKLLTNSEATVAAVYSALDWLKKEAGENDVVYLYFSGHGDVEVTDSSSLGYLLAYNSPPNNYRNNAIAVADINNDANYITINKKAKVILITDACHAGKMAGDFYKGKQFTANNLQLVLNNQVRLASCQANQLSAESVAWGGGRGVFSYYLLMGLNGMADTRNQGTVLLQQLDQFLDSAFKADKELISNNHLQSPVTDGDPQYPLARVYPATALAQKQSILTGATTPVFLPAGLQSLKPLGVQPIDAFFNIARQLTLEELDFNAYLALPPDSVPARLLADYRLCREEIRDRYYTNHYYDELDHPSLSGYRNLKQIEDLYASMADLGESKLATLNQQLEKLPPIVSRFREKYVQLVHEKVQDMINAYLKGDVAELEKRQYYHAGNRSYGNFLTQLQLAIKLLPPNEHLARLLQVQYNYIAGLIERLKTATSLKTDSLVNRAFQFQQKAVAQDPYAAYIHNELGNLYFQKENYDSAGYHFDVAAALTPTWAIPWSNKLRLNLAMGKTEVAKKALQTAEQLQPGLAYVEVNAGLLMEKDSNWLAAETYYLEALRLNNVHFLPFERLGHVYMLMGEYFLADFYLQEAKKRKDEFAVNSLNFRFGIELGGESPFQDINIKYPDCYAAAGIDDVQQTALENLALGIKYRDSAGSRQRAAIVKLQQALKLQPGIPLAAHYLGKIFISQQNWLKAAEMMQLAVDSSRSPADGFRFLNGLSKITPAAEDPCLLGFLLDSRYDVLEDYFLLAHVLEKLNRFDEAVKLYQSIARIENKRQLAQASFADIITEVDDSAYKTEYQTTAVGIAGEPNRYRVTKPNGAGFEFETTGIKILDAANPGIKFIEDENGINGSFSGSKKNSDSIIYFNLRNEILSFSRYPGSSTLQISIPVYYNMPLQERYGMAEYQDPMQPAGSIKAARLLEQTGKYEEAEQVLLNQVLQNQQAGFIRQQAQPDPKADNLYWLKINETLEAETYNFYNRVMSRFARDYRWKEKAGLFLYKRLKQSFDQVPLAEKQGFYESMNRYAYPFQPGIEKHRKQEMREGNTTTGDLSFVLPGTGEVLTIPMDEYDPVKKSLEFVQQSILLSGDAKTPPHLVQAQAQLHSWMGHVDEAIANFSELLQRQPGNVALRNELIPYLVLNKRYTDALNHLVILNDQQQLTQPQLLQLANYQAAAKNPQQAKTLLTRYQPKTGEEKNNKNAALARLYWLNNEPAKALTYLQIPLYQIKENEKPDELVRDLKTVLSTPLEIFRWYSIARLQALLKNDKQALQALKLAIAAGFNYKGLLDADPVWSRFKNKKNWQLLLGRNTWEDIDYPQIIEKISVENLDTIEFRIPKK